MDCTTTIRITTVPAAIITTSASGPEAGTETIPPDANCQMDCTSTIRVTTIPESFITTTQPYTGTDPITGPTTVTTIPPSGTNPGTVVIETPPAPTPDQHCDNAGLEYAIYTHNFYNEDAPKYSSFNAESFKTETPFYSGITDRIGIQPGQPATDPFVIYPGAPSESYQFKAVDHKAFLYAPTSGIYTISVPVSDEITLVWIGNNAISGWTRENANLAQDYVFQGSTPKLYTVELTAGSYNPIRVFWANAQGEFAFEIGITAPNGDVIVNGFQANADYLVQFACDKSTPEFPPWGAET
jgi:hypothetical protein